MSEVASKPHYPLAGERPLPFEGGPLAWVQAAELDKLPSGGAASRGALIAIAAGWLPLILLSLAGPPEALPEILRDLGVHARFLVAAPLLIVADAFCVPRLAAIGQHFRTAGIVPPKELARFDTAAASAKRLAASKTAGLIIVAVAYVTAGALALTAGSNFTPAWRGPVLGEGFTAAGWWHVLVSLPLLNALALTWLWRVLLWTRLLAQIAKLNLRLIPVHPDHAGGLLFVGYSVRAFAPVALALGALGAGALGNNTIRAGYSGVSLGDAITVVVMLIATFVLFAGPLLAFTGNVQQTWRNGVFRYGALAGNLGAEFERKWFDARSKVDAEVLESPDFSATTDLYQVVSNVYQMRFIPVDVPSLLLLAGATLAPLIPVALLTIPSETLSSTLKSLLL